ncbi:MAG TPA: carboxypeptidase-like regulatory domain-containing protein [archaeon]|nr:carboxypeptidase-like regulatory domain-containing protein [archaeon]
MSEQEKLINEIKQTVEQNNPQTTEKPKKKFTKIIFIIIAVIVLIIILILLFSGSKKTLEVYVVDEQNFSLGGVSVTINNEITQSTDAFGYTEFKDLKFKDLEIKATKENYFPTTKQIKLDKKLKEETITLEMDTTSGEFKGPSSERRREIIFKSYDVVVTDNLNVTFKCSNSEKIPEPRTTTVTNGRTNVLQPGYCGFLLVSVVSSNYELITDRNVSEDNIVELTRVNTNTGTLEVTVKDIIGQAVPYANLRLHNVDDLQTPTNESDVTYSTGTTDVYGKYKFNAPQSNYLLSIDKTGYISLPKLGPYNIVNNNITTANITLITASDLANINCSNPIYAPFCKDGKIDCNSPLLTGLVTPNPNGNGCTIGKLTNLIVKLKDQNTSVPVTGNISVYKRDQNVSSLITTRRDVNQTTFALVANNNYRIIVSNTEDNGYLPPTPVDVNNLSADTNTTIEIPLEYLSSLNSGSINVNVTKNGYKRANALVYLFYELDDEYVLYNPENPKTTNSSGDANFDLVKSKREYYAYAILRNESADGDSLPAQELDSNDVLELNVSLGNQSKTLNLKITPNQDYNISFFEVSGEQIPTENVIATNVTEDTNKTFVFNCGDDCSRIYLTIEKDDLLYQTDLISLFPGQVAYKEITFPTISEIQTATSFLGLYDSTGTIKIDNLTFSGNNDLTKEYKLKFKTVFGSDRTNVIKKAFIKAGRYLTENADFIYLTNTDLFVPKDTEIRTGCRYHGDLESFDSNYFITNFESDYSFNNCIAGKYKWLEFDFSDVTANIIEYSVNVKFKNEITTIDNYKIYYRSLNSDLETFSFSPNLSNWNEWSIRPEGYFYAPTQVEAIPFDNSNYSYVIKLFDRNSELTKFGSDYILYIGKDYNYSLSFIQFSDTNRTGDIITDTQNTNNNYVFTNSYFKDKTSTNPIIQTIDNNTSVNISSKTTSIGYYFVNNLIGKPIDFFSLTDQPTLRTQLFKKDNSSLATASTNILSYSESTYVPVVTSNATDGKIYVGSNDLNISLKNKTGNYENNIAVKYIVSGQTIATELGEITNNTLNTEIFIPLEDSGKTITFIFTIPGSNLPNNELTFSQVIGTGINIYDLDNKLITNNNRLRYDILLTNIGGKKKATDLVKDYIIKNNTNRVVKLEAVSVSDNEVFLEEIINQNLMAVNNLPKDLNQSNVISAGLHIDPDTDIQDINFSYNNIFTVKNTGEMPDITLYKDTNSSARIKILDIQDFSKFTTTNVNGFYEGEEGAGIELIKEVIDNISISYDLNLLFTDPINYDILDTQIVGEDISNYINFTQAHTNNSSQNRLVGNFNFTFVLKNINFTEIIEKDANINIKIGNQTENFIYEVPIKITLYPKNKSYQLSLPGTHLTIACKGEDNCSSTMVYNIKNNTKSYSLELTGIELLNSNPLAYESASIDIPMPITPQNHIEVPIKIDGNYSNLMTIPDLEETYNKQMNFYLTVNNVQVTEIKPITIIVTYIPETPVTVLNNIGVTGHFCMGVGGQAQGGDYFILGICDTEEQEACSVGESALPKVLYNWGDQTLNWKTLCIDDKEEYDADKTHCDSVQALYSIFTLISSSDYDTSKDYHIYLMYDGIESEDLLEDFRGHYDQFITHSISSAFSEKYLDSDHDKEITITKRTPNNNPTKEVGKYKIVVNDFDPAFTKDLNINLELVQNIPLNKNNLFYYIPIDGDFGVVNDKAHRVGYGSTIVGNYEYSDLLVTEPSATSIKLYGVAENCTSDCSGVTNITANYPSNYLVNWQVTDVLNTNGNLLDLAVDNTSGSEKKNIVFNFTPSRPINVFARVNGIKDKSFNYKLMVNNQFPISTNNLFKWKLFSDSNYNNAMDDIAVFGSHANYLRHELTKDKFGNNLDEKYLLESMIYLPVNVDYLDIKLTLSDLDNNVESRLYGLSSLEGTTELALVSRVPDIYSINQMLDQVKDGNACISNTLSSSKIKWVSDKIKITRSNRNQIETNYNN